MPRSRSHCALAAAVRGLARHLRAAPPAPRWQIGAARCGASSRCRPTGRRRTTSIRTGDRADAHRRLGIATPHSPPPRASPARRPRPVRRPRFSARALRPVGPAPERPCSGESGRLTTRMGLTGVAPAQRSRPERPMRRRHRVRIAASRRWRRRHPRPCRRRGPARLPRRRDRASIGAVPTHLVDGRDVADRRCGRRGTRRVVRAHRRVRAGSPRSAGDARVGVATRRAAPAPALQAVPRPRLGAGRGRSAHAARGISPGHRL